MTHLSTSPFPLLCSSAPVLCVPLNFVQLFNLCSSSFFKIIKQFVHCVGGHCANKANDYHCYYAHLYVIVNKLLTLEVWSHPARTAGLFHCRFTRFFWFMLLPLSLIALGCNYYISFIFRLNKNDQKKHKKQQHKSSSQNRGHRQYWCFRWIC